MTLHVYKLYIAFGICRYQMRYTAYNVATEDGITQTETCREFNEKLSLITRILCILLVYIHIVRWCTVHTRSNRISTNYFSIITKLFLDSLFPHILSDSFTLYVGESTLLFQVKMATRRLREYCSLIQTCLTEIVFEVYLEEATSSNILIANIQTNLQQ